MAKTMANKGKKGSWRTTIGNYVHQSVRNFCFFLPLGPFTLSYVSLPKGRLKRNGMG